MYWCDTEHLKWGGTNLCYQLLRGLNWPSMRDKLQSEELQSAHTDMHGLSLRTKSPQVTVQNIPDENTDVTSLPTHWRVQKANAGTSNAANTVILVSWWEKLDVMWPRHCAHTSSDFAFHKKKLNYMIILLTWKILLLWLIAPGPFCHQISIILILIKGRLFAFPSHAG